MTVEGGLSIKTQDQPRQRGRKSKDEALVLRDRYWALFLKSKLPNESYASLEKQLFTNLQVRRRANSLGYSQPFALSKVALGKRGLSPKLEEVPLVVTRAQELAPEVLVAYRSILWAALMGPATFSKTRDPYRSIASEVSARLSDRHFSTPSHARLGSLSLNKQGVCRLSRLWHRDALGLMLCHCSAVKGISKVSLTAEAYVFNLLHWSCHQDPALMAIKRELATLIKKRFAINAGADWIRNARPFIAPRISGIALGLRTLIDPRWQH